uniref:Stromal membrane-associated protein 1 n=1 Tax=Oryzias latipes TaxID=8090 RepID=A0A3P9H0N7_ORYLA
MTTRSEREKAQKLNEQHQAILSKMLREEDNKYCADCEAKGPRWASWNLGVFICIRCAGIHRNLGVHISRVKSVNLDQWTSEQIQSIQDMGNTKARRLYEANLPDSFRRPQTDQAVEFFIRDKYEKKKYYSKNGLDRSSVCTPPSCWSPCFHTTPQPGPGEESRPVPKVSPAKPAEPPVNLLGLDAPAAVSPNNGNTSTSQNSDLDIFGPMVSNPLPSTPTQAAVGGGAGSGSTQGDLDLFSESSSGSTKAEQADASKKTLSKDSILSLYGTSTGMFMAPSQMQFPVQATAGYQAFPGMGAGVPPTTVMGAMMAQSGAAMMGPNPGMMVGMTMPNGFMGNAPAAGMMGMAPGMVGPQGGAMPAGMVPAQGMYAIQPGQQAQWSMGQVSQQMSGLNVNGAGGQMAFAQPPSAMGGWAASGSGQTLSTQLWK